MSAEASSLTSTAGFTLIDLPLLSRSTVDRQELLVNDTAKQAQLWPSGRVLVLDDAGRVTVRARGTELVFAPATTFGDTPPAHAVLLGEQDGIGYWGLRVSSSDDERERVFRWEPPELVDGEQKLDLRLAAPVLSARDAGLFTTASAVLNWYRVGKFCAKCGTEVNVIKAGWASLCPGCGREEYPRTDPAVICLVHDDRGVNGENVLLARGTPWPPGRLSVLAGFVEAGESLEDCVKREIAEEVGVAVRDVRYLGNQPWPFPRSLMIGFAAVADHDAPLRPADGEIAEAHWISRTQVRAILAGEDDSFRLPGLPSIANVMVRSWAAVE
ncbi:MAG TPA: NAD(+) diphosphatase [Pseudonocardiaceae bacterium]|nr:NAD(+) diphosphatase [Pseudonocardiaceae bacterium]